MWNPQLSITEADAVLNAKNGAVTSIRIIKNDDSFVVLLQLAWRKDELFLCTTRNNKHPREFKHIGRLLEYVEENYPGIDRVELVLNEPAISEAMKEKQPG